MIVDAVSRPLARPADPENDGARLQGKALVTRNIFLCFSISLNRAIRSAKCTNQQQLPMRRAPQGTPQDLDPNKIDGPVEMGSVNVLINRANRS
jgi:hypothetical protein